MAKAKRRAAQERQNLINCFIQFIKDSYHGITAVYHRKTESIIVYPQIGYHGLDATDAKEILALFLSDSPEGTSVTFSGAERDQATYHITKSRGTGMVKKYRCTECGGKVNREGVCRCY